MNENNNKPISIRPFEQPDEELAAKIKADLQAAFIPLFAVLDFARSKGLQVSYACVPDQYGRMTCQNLTVFRPL